MDDSYGLAELHEQLMYIMDDIDRVCRRHGIKYTLTGGSMLGAIRHKGFIPWDDDMDIRMLRDQFELFKKVYPEEKNKDFIIGHPCNPATYSVINPKYQIPGVIQVEETLINPFISIFPLDNAPKSKVRARMKAHALRILSGMMGKPTQYPAFPEKSKKMWNITLFAGKLFGKKRAAECFERLCLSDNNKETGLLASYTGNGKGIYPVYPKEIYLTYADFSFEDRTYMGMEKYKEYLKLFFGDDYMTPVPPEERTLKHYINQGDKK